MAKSKKIIWHSASKMSLDVFVEKIFLDTDNPRMSDKNFSSEKDLVTYMYQNYSLDELALSMTQFWYFDAEPVVVIPKALPAQFTKLDDDKLATSDEYKTFIKDPNTEFIVVEGNRRISTIKILLDIEGYGQLPQIRKEIFKESLSEWIKQDLKKVPVIVYPYRHQITPYLWVRHIWWNKPWDPYAQALYIANLIEQKDYDMQEVKELMSDKSGKVIKNYVSLKLLDIAEKEGYSVENAINHFSFLILSIGQRPIKDYIGLVDDLGSLKKFDDSIIKKKDKFLKYFTWIFGDKSRGTLPLIQESRDITKKLSKILASSDATTYLEKHSDILWAFERSDWEKEMVINWLASADRTLRNVLVSLEILLGDQKIYKDDIKTEIFWLRKNLKDLMRIVWEEI